VGLAEPSAGRAAAPERDAEVSRADPRSIEEARAVEPMQRAVIVHVPPEWLRAGRYRIDLELRDPERAAVIGRGRYRLQVEAP
jgi:hypothetical protein